MLRVHATIKNSEYAPSLKSELRDLASWVQEIHKGMYDRLVGYLYCPIIQDFDETIYSKDSTGIFANYAERSPTSPGNFYDAASTALLASTVYRAAQFLGQHGYLSHADKSRQALSAQIRTRVQAQVHFFHPMLTLPQTGYYSPLLTLIRLVGWQRQSHRKVRRFWFRCIRHGRTGKRHQRAVANDVLPLSGARVLSMVAFIIWLIFFCMNS
jgi:hypothetical protein